MSLPTSERTALDTAADKLLEEGPAVALTFLTQRANLQDEAVFRRVWAIVFLHRKRIEAEAGPEFLRETVFDPFFCQCSICQRCWSVSPLLTSPAIRSEELAPHLAKTPTRQCPTCGKVYCRRCAASAGSNCTCGNPLEPLTRPNGRKPVQEDIALEKVTSSRSGRSSLRAEAEQPLREDPDLHLYFGIEGIVGIAIDPSFPVNQPASVETHLDWAETLYDAGQYYQAQQQLDLLGAGAEHVGRANWLRARLRWTQFNNLIASFQHGKPHVFRVTYEKMLARKALIRGLLGEACRQTPGDGRFWLTQAQAYEELKIRDEDRAQAIECLKQAEKLLGDDPQTLLARGQLFYNLGECENTVSTLQRIPASSPDYSQAQRQADLAGLAIRCRAQPFDIEAHLRLGYWLWQHGQREVAKSIFDRIMKEAPESAEGQFVQGLLVWFDFRRPQRFNLAHGSFRRALRKNADFSLAYAYLGILYQAIASSDALAPPREQLDFEPGDPEECFRRAVELDQTCEVALSEQGLRAIDCGDIPTALSFFERAAAADSPDPWVYWNLAVIYLGTRQFGKQERVYDKAISLDPRIELKPEYVDRILARCNFEY